MNDIPSHACLEPFGYHCPWCTDVTQRHTIAPVELRYLLKIYYSGDPVPVDDSSVMQEFVARMVTAGMIEREVAVPGCYRCTDGGKKWIDDILNTPMPVKKWVSGRRE